MTRAGKKCRRARGPLLGNPLSYRVPQLLIFIVEAHRWMSFAEKDRFMILLSGAGNVGASSVLAGRGTSCRMKLDVFFDFLFLKFNLGA